MSFTRSTRITGRRLLATIVAGSLAFAAAFGVAAPASAAEVDLTVNVTSDRGSYAADAPAIYTIRVDNRSDRATATGATVVLDVPNMAGSAVAWSTAVSGVAMGGGAAAPTSFAVSDAGRSVTATLPSIPGRGWVSYSLTAPGNPANGISGSLTVTARVAAAVGDTDVDTATDTATVGVVILPRPADYSTSIANAPTTGVADGATVTVDVAVVNTGVTNNLRSSLALTGDLSGVAQIIAATLLSGPGASPTLTPGTTGQLDVSGMPSGSTSVFRVEIQVGATCTPTGNPRNLTLASTVAPVGGVAEDVSLNADNTASAAFSVLTPVCLEADVSVTSIAQTVPTSGAIPHDGAFGFVAEYTNTGPDTAPSTIDFVLTWATGEGAPTLSADPACVATGGAVCPTSWLIESSANAGTPGQPGDRGTSSVAAIGSGAVVPAGGTLTITYSGIGGAADALICGTRTGSALTSITADPSFADADPLNNFDDVFPTEDIGVECGISRDFQVEVPWFKNDPDSTPLSQAGSVSFAPGDVAYFDITGINASDPDQGGLGIAGTAPYVDLNGYTLINNFGMNAPANFIAGNQQFDLSDPGNVFWQSDTGSLPVSPGTLSVPLLSGNPLAITCQAAPLGVCPDTAVRQQTLYPGVHPYPFMLDLGWTDPEQTVLPAGSTMRLLAAFKIPELPEQYQQAGCVPQGVLIDGSPTATSVTLPFYLIAFNEQTTSLSGEVAPARDQWRGVRALVEYTRCTQNLAIDQTIVDVGGAPIPAPTLPGDRTVRYRVTITNPAGSAPLSIPRFTEAFSPAVVAANATCDPSLSTGGAVCPTGTFTSGVRSLADGSTEPIGSGEAQLDISWGSSGAPTLPADSSVTFFVTASYPPETATTATAVASAFDATPGSPFPLVSDSDAVAPTAAAAILSIRKSVSPIDPAPGETVSFVVDLLNAGDAPSAAFFSDPLHPDLAAANPTGFASVSCQPITAAMNLLDGPLGSTPCPTITSDATGLRATIPSFAANSGLRITYTAIAPSEITSTPNIASIYADATIATLADRSAWANFLVTPLPAAMLAATGASLAPTAGVLLAGMLLILIGGGFVALRSRLRH